MPKAPPNIKRGRMTARDHYEIERLAATMRKPTPGKIALRINRHVSTVNWYMLTHGLVDQKANKRHRRPYVRNGQTIYPYAPEHDARIEVLRAAGMRYREIAETITREFGIARSAHGVEVRMIQLAAVAGG